MSIPGTAYRGAGYRFDTGEAVPCKCINCTRELRAMRDGFVLGYLTGGGQSEHLDGALQAAGFDPIRRECEPTPVAVAQTWSGPRASASAAPATQPT